MQSNTYFINVELYVQHLCYYYFCSFIRFTLIPLPQFSSHCVILKQWQVLLLFLFRRKYYFSNIEDHHVLATILDFLITYMHAYQFIKIYRGTVLKNTFVTYTSKIFVERINKFVYCLEKKLKCWTVNRFGTAEFTLSEYSTGWEAGKSKQGLGPLKKQTL